MGLLIEAATAHQKLFESDKTNPVHVTAHFLRPCEAFASEKGVDTEENQSQDIPASFEAHIRMLKDGKSFCTLSANFVQKVMCFILAYSVADERNAFRLRLGSLPRWSSVGKLRNIHRKQRSFHLLRTRGGFHTGHILQIAHLTGTTSYGISKNLFHRDMIPQWTL